MSCERRLWEIAFELRGVPGGREALEAEEDEGGQLERKVQRCRQAKRRE